MGRKGRGEHTHFLSSFVVSKIKKHQFPGASRRSRWTPTSSTSPTKVREQSTFQASEEGERGNEKKETQLTLSPSLDLPFKKKR